MKRWTWIIWLAFIGAPSFAQHLNLGITFQYHMLKQVKVNANHIIPHTSYNYYQVTDNRWKLFSAGQSMVVGTVAQLEFKRFYIGIEPSYELNTYDYHVQYTEAAGQSENVSFKTLFMQVDIPVYVGYQFKTSDFLRYSFYGGAGPVLPTAMQVNIKSLDGNPSVGNRYSYWDMRDILYNDKTYWNAIAGLGIHFASLGRLDIRYTNRMGSPGTEYKMSLRSVGIGMTFFIPLHLMKKRIYVED